MVDFIKACSSLTDGCFFLFLFSTEKKKHDMNKCEKVFSSRRTKCLKLQTFFKSPFLKKKRKEKGFVERWIRYVGRYGMQNWPVKRPSAFETNAERMLSRSPPHRRNSAMTNQSLFARYKPIDRQV